MMTQEKIDFEHAHSGQVDPGESSTLKMEDHQWLIVMRKQLGYKTQTDLAKDLGVDSSSVSRWERGVHPVPPKVMEFVKAKLRGEESQQVGPLREPNSPSQPNMNWPAGPSKSGLSRIVSPVINLPTPVQPVPDSFPIVNGLFEFSGFNFNGVGVQVVRHGGKLYMEPKHLGAVLGYERPAEYLSQLIERHKDEIHPHMVRFLNGPIALTTQGVFLVCMLSRAPQAQEFREWFAAAVDKSQSGGSAVTYSDEQTKTPMVPNPQDYGLPPWMSQLSMMLAEQQKQTVMIAQILQSNQQVLSNNSQEIQELKQGLDRVSNLGSQAVDVATASIQESFQRKEYLAALILEAKGYVGSLVQQRMCPLTYNYKARYSGAKGFSRFVSDCKKAGGISNWQRSVHIGSVSQWEEARDYAKHVVETLGGVWPPPGHQRRMDMEP